MAKFDIIEAVKKGAIETWKDRNFLLKGGVIAAILHTISFYFISLAVKVNESPIEGQPPFYIEMGMNTYIAIVFFVIGLISFSHLFVYQSRLILIRGQELEENKDDTAREERRKAYILGGLIIVGYFVFKQILAESAGFISESVSTISSFAVVAFSIVNFLIVIWLLRFGVLHIPAAIGFPVKDFLNRVRGIKFSFYLVGLMMAVLVPCALSLSVVAMIVLSLLEWALNEQLALIAVAILLGMAYVISFTILNAASIFAVDEVMKHSEVERED